jgi:hypothetical protein
VVDDIAIKDNEIDESVVVGWFYRKDFLQAGIVFLERFL